MSHSGSSPLATWLSEIARRATIEIRRSLASVGDAKVSVAVTSSGISKPPIGAKSIANRSRSGPWGMGGRLHVRTRGK